MCFLYLLDLCDPLDCSQGTSVCLIEHGQNIEVKKMVLVRLCAILLSNPSSYVFVYSLSIVEGFIRGVLREVSKSIHPKNQLDL